MQLESDITHHGNAGRAGQNLRQAKGVHEFLFRDPFLLMDEGFFHQRQNGRTAIADDADIKRRLA